MPRSNRCSHGTSYVAALKCDTCYRGWASLCRKTKWCMSDIVKDANHISMSFFRKTSGKIFILTFPLQRVGKTSPNALARFHLVDIGKRLTRGPFFDCSYTAQRQMCGPAVTNVRTNVVCVFKTNSSLNFVFPSCFPFSLLTLRFAFKKSLK